MGVKVGCRAGGLRVACAAWGLAATGLVSAQTFADTNAVFSNECASAGGRGLGWFTNGQKLARMRFADGAPAGYEWVEQLSLDGHEVTFTTARGRETWVVAPSAIVLVERSENGRVLQAREQPSPSPMVRCQPGTPLGDVVAAYLASKGLRPGMAYTAGRGGERIAAPAEPAAVAAHAAPAAPTAPPAVAARHPALAGSALKNCADLLRLWDRIWAGYPERRCVEQTDGNAALLLHGKTNQWRQYRYWPAFEVLETSADGNWAGAHFLSAYTARALGLNHAAIARLGPERVRAQALLQTSDQYNGPPDEGVAEVLLNLWRRVQAHDLRAYVELADHLGTQKLPVYFQGMNSAAQFLDVASQRGVGDASFKLAALADSEAERTRLMALALRQGSVLAQREQAAERAQGQRLAQLRRDCSGRPAVQRGWLERTANSLGVAPGSVTLNRVAVDGALCRATFYHPRGTLNCSARFDDGGVMRDCD